MKRLLLVIAAILAVAAGLRAQRADTVVSLVNFYPGPVFYELEGHTVLRITFPDGRDTAVSWGLFDFSTDDFLYRFVKGETDYQCGAIPWQLCLDSYRAQHRRAVEHRLNFTPEQTRRLVGLVATNLRPGNRVYRYNYVKDNCATRPLRLIELAAGDTVLLPPSVLESQSSWPVTYRYAMRRFHRNYPWYQFGIDLALGSGIDKPIDSRATTFAPALLDEQIAHATAGGRRLVESTQVVLDYPPYGAEEGPTPWYLTPLFVCCLVLAAATVLTVRDLRRRRVTRWFDAVLFGIFGLAGLVLTFLIFVSVHEATSPNWLYAWLNPLCFIPTVFIWLKKYKKVVLSYQIANFVVLLAMLCAWPWIPQSANVAFLPLVLADMLRAASYISVTYKRLHAA